MGKMTAQQRAELEAALAADDEADDDDAAFEGSWWEEDPKTGRKRGGEVKGRSGLSIMQKWAPDLFDPPAPDPDDPAAKKTGGAVKKPAAAARKSVFGARPGS